MNEQAPTEPQENTQTARPSGEAANLSGELDAFRAGARAMFDGLMMYTANNYHGNPSTNDICQEENRAIEHAVNLVFAEVCTENDFFEYYYKVDGCPAKQAGDGDCICWHAEGTGPHKNERHNSEVPYVKWRIKPLMKIMR